MKHERKEIDAMPEFESDIDPRTLSEIKSEEARSMAIYLDKERKRSQWVADRAIEAYNMGVRNTAFLRKYGPMITGLMWLGGMIIAAVASGLGERIWVKLFGE